MCTNFFKVQSWSVFGLTTLLNLSEFSKVWICAPVIGLSVLLVRSEERCFVWIGYYKCYLKVLLLIDQNNIRWYRFTVQTSYLLKTVQLSFQDVQIMENSYFYCFESGNLIVRSGAQ